MRRFFAVVLALSTTGACASRAGKSVALYEAGDSAGAARAADEGLARHPGDDDLWRMRIRAALAQGDAANIAKSYAAYHQQRGDHDNELLRELSVATLGQKDCQQADVLEKVGAGVPKERQCKGAI